MLEVTAALAERNKKQPVGPDRDLDASYWRAAAGQPIIDLSAAYICVWRQHETTYRDNLFRPASKRLPGGENTETHANGA